MATIPIQTYPLLAVPFNAASDFTVLAGHCETFAETLIESNDPTLKNGALRQTKRLSDAAPAHAVRARPAPSY